MTITYPLDLPATPKFNRFTLRRVPVVAVSKSPYTGQQQAYAFPGQWWEAEAGLPDMTRAEIGAWRAFFAKLNGQEGTFLMGDPTAATPRGLAASAPGTPLVDGVHAARAQTLSIKGGPNSNAGWLLSGDYIQLGSGSTSRLHMVLADADTDGTGKTALTLWPRLRSALAGDEAVTVSNCRGVFRLSANETGDEARPFPFFMTSFTAIEAV